MRRHRKPIVVVLAGPNGAGKSTVGPTLLKETLGVMDFVNADTIAQGLSAFQPEGTAIQAGRVMLSRIEELAGRRLSFALESTLAGRALATRLLRLKRQGYRIHVIFIWLASEELAIQRVAGRVRLGGHHVPAEVVRRRYRRGTRNFLSLYERLADNWQVYDNSKAGRPQLVAARSGKGRLRVYERLAWGQVTKGMV